MQTTPRHRGSSRDDARHVPRRPRARAPGGGVPVRAAAAAPPGPAAAAEPAARSGGGEPAARAPAETAAPAPAVTRYTLPPEKYEKARRLGQLRFWFTIVTFVWTLA